MLVLETGMLGVFVSLDFFLKMPEGGSFCALGPGRPPFKYHFRKCGTFHIPLPEELPISASGRERRVEVTGGET